MNDATATKPAASPVAAKRVLVLQGGGALGSYQAGAYDALCTHGFDPAWVAGISIGAINAAIIAGNPKEKRVARLKEFWELVSSPIPWRPLVRSGDSRTAFNEGSAALIATFGVPGFFTPRMPPAPLWPRGTPQAISYYDTAPLRQTLDRLVDFDLINSKQVRFSVGAVNVRTGNFAYFDNARQTDRPRAHHGVGRAAARLSAGRDRRRALLGRRPRLEHAAGLRAGQREERGSADLPGRPVQRPRSAAGLDPRGDRTREGHPLFQPHPAQHRRQPQAAQYAARRCAS